VLQNQYTNTFEKENIIQNNDSLCLLNDLEMSRNSTKKVVKNTSKVVPPTEMLFKHSITFWIDMSF